MKKNISTGFTLLELLIACSIIGTLLIVFLPCIHKIQGYTLIATCQHNLHQLSLGFFLYAQNHGGKLPHKDRDSDTGPNHCWFDRLDSYLFTSNLHTIKQCPCWDGYNSCGDTEDRHSIKMNGGLCPKERLPETPQDYKNHCWYWPRVWDIASKSKTVLLLDGRMDPPFHTHTGTRIHNPFYDVENRHLGGANLLFLDGSSKFVNATSLGLTTHSIGWDFPSDFVWEPYNKVSD